MRRPADPRDLVLVVLAAARSQPMRVEEVGHKAANIGAKAAKAELGKLVMEGLVRGSSSTGFLLTHEGSQLVGSKFEVSDFGSHTSYAARPTGQARNRGRWLQALLLVVVALAVIVAMVAL